MDSFFQTNPLPQVNDYNNRIYEFNPDLIDKRQLKRCKSIKLEPAVPSMCSSTISRSLTGRKSRRRRPIIKLDNSDLPPSQYDFDSIVSDSEFSFTSNSDSDIDLESLPDLIDDDGTPLSSPNPQTPKHLPFNSRYFDDYKPRKLEFHEPVQNSIFDIPEIVYKILEFAAIDNDNSPKENTPIRRKPLSYNHALLIHGNEEMAEKSMKQEPKQDSKWNVLFNCLLVNKLFNSVARELIGQKFCFDEESKLIKYLHNPTIEFRPSIFKLYKMFHVNNSHLQSTMEKMLFHQLTEIEIFMCPKFLPPPEMFEFGSKLKKLLICGSKLVNDEFLIMVSEKCPNLEILDIRGCENVTDTGIYHIGQNCHNLKCINFGRKSRGHLITDVSITKLIENNTNLNTIGLAGCHITDKVIWDLTSYCNYSIERLSINNCPLITNQSIPLILHANYFPYLNVLEIRFTNINNLKPIIEFKRRQEFSGNYILIELCEQLSYKMRQQELEMDRIISQRIFDDIQDWANNSDDGDSCYRSLLSLRSSIA